MSDSEIAELVAGIIPAGTSAEQIAAVVRAAEGNPLYAEELAGTGELGPPPSISAVVLAKAAGMPAGARTVADQICVADGGVPHEVLAAALAMPEEAMIAAARLAVNSGLVVATGDGYAFRHALIQQVLYSDLLPGERRRLHRRLAQALADHACDPASLAQHWHLAGCQDRAAIAALSAARLAVAARAYPEADRCYVLALDLARWLPEPKREVLTEAARAASWAGHPDRAANLIADGRTVRERDRHPAAHLEAVQVQHGAERRVPGDQVTEISGEDRLGVLGQLELAGVQRQHLVQQGRRRARRRRAEQLAFGRGDLVVAGEYGQAADRVDVAVEVLVLTASRGTAVADRLRHRVGRPALAQDPAGALSC